MAESITYLPNGEYKATIIRIVQGRGLVAQLASGLLLFLKGSYFFKENIPIILNVSGEKCIIVYAPLAGAVNICEDTSYKVFHTPEDIVEELL